MGSKLSSAAAALTIIFGLFVVAWGVLLRPPQVDRSLPSLTQEEFAAAVIRAQTPLMDLKIEFVLDNPVYLALAARGGANMENCLIFLADPHYTEDQKIVAITTMYRSDYDGSIVFLDKLMKLYWEKKISIAVIGMFLRPYPRHSTVVYYNFFRPKLRDILWVVHREFDKKGLGARYIDDILSGHWFRVAFVYDAKKLANSILE